MHNKSFPLPALNNDEKLLQKIQNRDNEIFLAAKQSILLFDLLVDEISEIDPEEKIWIQGHLSEYSMTPEAK